MATFKIFFIFLCFAIQLNALELSEEVLQQVQPYLLPSDHEVKPILDDIFLNTEFRILSSEEAMINAGFNIIYYRKSKGLIVASHPKMEKYLIKAYLDAVPDNEWSRWISRIEGAKQIKQVLKKNGYKHFMKVPKKWMYRILDNHKGEFSKHFILVVEDMEILSEQENKKTYKKIIDLPLLHALYTTLYETGFSDARFQNLPFSIDQRIAFIDTEYLHAWPVHFELLTRYFSPAMQKKWKKLISQNE